MRLRSLKKILNLVTARYNQKRGVEKKILSWNVEGLVFSLLLAHPSEVAMPKAEFEADQTPPTCRHILKPESHIIYFMTIITLLNFS